MMNGPPRSVPPTRPISRSLPGERLGNLRLPRLILAAFSWICFNPRETEILEDALKWVEYGAVTLLKLLPVLEFNMPQHMYKILFDLTRVSKNFTAMVRRIVKIIIEGRRERINWRRRGLIYWFYYPPPNDRPYFGNRGDIIELAGDILELIETTTTYIEQEMNLIMLTLSLAIVTFIALCYWQMHRGP